MLPFQQGKERFKFSAMQYTKNQIALNITRRIILTRLKIMMQKARSQASVLELQNFLVSQREGFRHIGK